MRFDRRAAAILLLHLRKPWSKTLKLGVFLSPSVDAVDAKFCICNLWSISQAGRRRSESVSQHTVGRLSPGRGDGPLASRSRSQQPLRSEGKAPPTSWFEMYPGRPPSLDDRAISSLHFQWNQSLMSVRAHGDLCRKSSKCVPV